MRSHLALRIAAIIQMTWFVFAAPSATDKGGRDVPDKPDKSAATLIRSPRFHFGRLRYRGGVPGYIKNWYTDYPNMDTHLSKLMQRLTNIDVGEPALVDLAGPDIFNYPLIYTVEPEQMVLSQGDAEILRQYLDRGGMWFADDFHGDYEFNQFVEQINRVIPHAAIVELDTSHPLFHAAYDIDTIVQVTNDAIAECPECDQWENGPSGKIPKVFAVHDHRGRIIILMAWNTDLGDGLEWADDPAYPAYYSTYAFKFVTNLVVYAMTH
jgi:Domain of unknown function (DUF4159)